MNLVVTSSLLRTSLFTLLILANLIASAQLEYPTGTAMDDGLYDSEESYDISEYTLSLPKIYLLDQYVPKVGNQLNYPHDVAWSIASAATIVESVYIGSFNKANTSKLLKSPYFINMLWSEDIDVCSDPISLQQTFYKLRDTGLPLFRDYIKLCPSSVDEKIIQKASSLPVFNYEKVFDREMSDEEKVQRIKTKIALDRPVIMSFHCPPSFVTSQDFWSPKELMDEEFPLHTVVIVGFDDERYGGAFKVLNSWSSRWGNEGYMWVRYKDVEFIRYAYSVTYKDNEGDNLSILSGSLEFVDTEKEMDLPFVQFNPKGFYKYDVGEKDLKFSLTGATTKPFYIKMYYKNAGEVTQIYPLDTWRSSLFEYSFDEFSIPGKGNFYQIEKDKLSSLYLFISLDNIDDLDFTSLVEENSEISDLIRSRDFKFTRQVVWDNEKTKFSARLYEGEIIPLILGLSFE